METEVEGGRNLGTGRWVMQSLFIPDRRSLPVISSHPVRMGAPEQGVRAVEFVCRNLGSGCDWRLLCPSLERTLALLPHSPHLLLNTQVPTVLWSPAGGGIPCSPLRTTITSPLAPDTKAQSPCCVLPTFSHWDPQRSSAMRREMGLRQVT